MTEVKGTKDLKTFNETYAPHSGAPRTFPRQLAVTINAELERALVYAMHLDSCGRYEFLAEVDDEYCTCGLQDLKAYARRLAPHRYDAEGVLKPEELSPL